MKNFHNNIWMILVLAILSVSNSLMAIEYPTYYPDRVVSPIVYHVGVQHNMKLGEVYYSGYSVIAVNGSTTTGEGRGMVESFDRDLRESIYNRNVEHFGDKENLNLQTEYVGAYSIVATGGMTTDQTAFNGRRGAPRRASYSGSTPPANPNVGDTWTYNGEEFQWNGENWVDDFGHVIDPGPWDKNNSPIGSPILPFLLFAVMACGVIYYRRRKVARA